MSEIYDTLGFYDPKIGLGNVVEYEGVPRVAANAVLDKVVTINKVEKLPYDCSSTEFTMTSRVSTFPPGSMWQRRPA